MALYEIAYRDTSLAGNGAVTKVSAKSYRLDEGGWIKFSDGREYVLIVKSQDVLSILDLGDEVSE
jgi:hypothetical protein